ncbi:MAG TPA: STM3941 family protein [Bacteroidia bacterium]|jgi:hypothetical protein|nr:STM3941 family protein [Bacteroidia bacterium]
MKPINQTVEIPLSKRKIILLFFGAIISVLLSYRLWTIADTQTHYPTIYVQCVSILGIILFGFGIIFAPIKLFDKRPGLIISDEGIQDNSGISSGRFYPWINITGFKMVKIKRTKLLLIFMDNTEEIINRESTWKQKMMKLSLSTYGTPISIGSGTLKCNFDELEKLLSDRLNIIKQPLRPNQ